ncbi:hemolysin-type calcium-binding repeat family protein [Synechococcus sp. WH 8101]|uniref:leucine-rich repeat protein n=1 Tax=Synechococcus sp. WH 8101 TaxID=59932 RepID=UPI00164B7CCA|nr:leucine-rich repeat protein [Synechococcus sp. WH 8101]QNI46333.1 hemolysin-type calcium-binding repeat family protein [Synechococcus sp. WH 8101]
MTILTSTDATSLKKSQGSSVVIPNNYTSIDTRAFLNKNLKSVTIPDSITSIGYEAFRNSGLKSVTIGNGVTSIDKRAFYGNQLTSVTIPNGVKFPGGNPFDNRVSIIYQVVNSGNGTAGAITGDPDGNGTVTAYQWYKNNNAITGGTNSTYTVPDDGAGTYKVAITYTDGQGFIATVDSANQVVTALSNGNGTAGAINGAEDVDFVSNSSPSVALTTESTTNAEVEQPIVVSLPDGVAKLAVRVATEAIVMPEEFAEKVVDLGVQTPVYSIDFEIPLPSVFRYNPLTKSFQRTKRTKANLPLAPLLGDLSLSDGLGRRIKSRRPVYFGIDGAGVISDLSYDPLRNAGARFYDTDDDNSADFLSLGLVDGGFGDKDGIVNGVIVDPSMPGIVDLTPSITEQTNRFLKVGDPSNTAPAALALQASLTTRSRQATTVGYVILNEGEDPSIVGDINTFKERARTLFSSLKSNDVVLNDSMRFEREFLLRNGQSVRFFAITDHSLSELTSLEDARFSFLEAEVDAITGTASIGGGGGYNNSIAFSLSLLEGDQSLSALIAQEQTVAPLLDFTAFSETDTITGAIVQAREAEEDTITGFYRVLDIDGSVLSADGTLLTPGDAGYAAAALRDANQVATFSNLSVADGQSTSTDFSLQDSGTFAPFAQVNGHTFFAFSEANADGLSHFRSLGTNLFGLEDQLGGGDLDFDDHIIGFNISGLTRSDQAAVA